MRFALFKRKSFANSKIYQVIKCDSVHYNFVNLQLEMEKVKNKIKKISQLMTTAGIWTNYQSEQMTLWFINKKIIEFNVFEE